MMFVSRSHPLCRHTGVFSSVRCNTIITIAALCNRAGHYIFALWFLFSIFFPRLISAVGDWMSTILPHKNTRCGLSANLECLSEMCCTRLAENTWCKNYEKNRHLRTIAQRCRAISSQLRQVSTAGKHLLNSNISPTRPYYNMVNFGPLAAEIVSLVWGTPANFNKFRTYSQPSLIRFRSN